MKQPQRAASDPALFGMAVIVPPQTWVEVVGQHGYAHGYLWFWTHDYFRFGTLDSGSSCRPGTICGSSSICGSTRSRSRCVMLVPGVGQAAAGVRHAFSAAAARCGCRSLFLMITQYWLFHRDDDTHDLFNDGIAHLQYLPAFLFGFGLAGSRAAMDGLARYWKLSAAIALGCYAIVAGLLIAYPDFSFPDAANSPNLRRRPRNRRLGRDRRVDRRRRAVLEP